MFNYIKFVAIAALVVSLSGCIVYSEGQPVDYYDCPRHHRYINGTHPEYPIGQYCPYHRRYTNDCHYCNETRPQQRQRGK